MAKANKKDTKEAAPKVEQAKVGGSEIKAYGSKVRPNYDEQFEKAIRTTDSALEAAELMADMDVPSLTIKQTAKLIGLNPMTIRSRLRKGSWTRQHDEFGRVIVDIIEIVHYLKNKGARGGRRLYKIFLDAEEAKDVEMLYPESKLKLANPGKAAKAAAKAKAEAEAS